MLLLWLLVVVLSQLTAACIPSKRCDCDSKHPWKPECYISSAAPEGFKCRCEERTCMRSCSKSCYGVAVPCRNDEACPGGQYSACACRQGGGRCNGYPNYWSTRCSYADKVEASSSLTIHSAPYCDCMRVNGVSGGCIIEDAAPQGFKCHCYKGGPVSCHAHVIGCNQDEYCPANDYTYCACRRGGGDCDGYSDRDKNQVCDLGSNCDCNRLTDWTRDRYTVTEVTFNTDQLTRSSPRPVELGHVLDLPNASGVEQSQRMTVTNTRTTESSFERTHGISVEQGVKFLASLPIDSLTLSPTQSFTYGEKSTISNQTSHWYTCNSPPRTHTQCKIFLLSYDTTVPYTMVLKHKVIPDCECKSYGTWQATTSYFSQKIAEEIGPCHRVFDGKCVDP